MTSDTLAPEVLQKMDAYRRATRYLSVGQRYLYDNPLLREPHARPGGHEKAFQAVSFPGGISSHVAPTTPGSINEGGELG